MRHTHADTSRCRPLAHTRRTSSVTADARKPRAPPPCSAAQSTNAVTAPLSQPASGSDSARATGTGGTPQPSQPTRWLPCFPHTPPSTPRSTPQTLDSAPHRRRSSHPTRYCLRDRIAAAALHIRPRQPTRRTRRAAIGDRTQHCHSLWFSPVAVSHTSASKRVVVPAMDDLKRKRGVQTGSRDGAARERVDGACSLR